MKFEFDLPDSIGEKEFALCYLDDPVPAVFFNIFEKGDVWIKTQGCSACPIEQTKKCCGTCPMWTEKGCFFHLTPTSSNKPYNCVISPDPRTFMSICCIEFECLKGTRIGQIRRVQDPQGIFLLHGLF